MKFNPTYPDIDMDIFKEFDWKIFNCVVDEAIPRNAPGFCGKEVDLRNYLNSNYAGEKKTRRYWSV